MMKRSIYLIVICWIFALLPTRLVLAHPHAWIDLDVAVLTDGDGKVTGLRQFWFFDEAYSAFVVEGMRQQHGGDLPETALKALAAENLGNLADYSWFTHLRLDGQALYFKVPTQFAQDFTGGRLIMAFDLMLQQPVSVAGAEMSWQFYDPSYYIEMLYQKTAEPITLAADLEHCSALVIDANPSEEMVMMAALLDKNDKAEDGLGALFAETATLTCR